MPKKNNSTHSQIKQNAKNSRGVIQVAGDLIYQFFPGSTLTALILVFLLLLFGSVWYFAKRPDYQNVESLPNGQYLYGVAYTPDGEGSRYIVFQKKRTYSHWCLLS